MQAVEAYDADQQRIGERRSLSLRENLRQLLHFWYGLGVLPMAGEQPLVPLTGGLGEPAVARDVALARLNIYQKRARDCYALEASTRVSFQEWRSLVHELKTIADAPSAWAMEKVPSV